MNRVLMLVMAALVCATSAMAAEPSGTLKKIKDRKTIVLGYRESSWPFSFVDADGQPAGYSVDLCVRIAEAVQQQLALPKLAVRWIKLTPENRITAVADGTVDMECGSTTSTLSRQQQVDFTITTFVDGGSLLATDASGIESVKDLAGLENGTADAYASDRVILIGLGRKSKDVSKLSLSTQLFSYEPYGLMLRRGDADFRLTANRTLSRLFRSEDIVRIYDKWFGDLGKPTVALVLMYAISAVPE